MEINEVCNLFPPMGDDEMRSLAEDIAKHGLREPIWTYQGKVIDGRHRLRACKTLEMEPKYREWDGEGSLLAFVVAQNLHRRHLSESQRAMLAAKLKPMFEEEVRKQLAANGKGKKTRKQRVQNFAPSGEGKSRDKAAKTTGVSHTSVDFASKVLNNGAPELIAAVESDQVSVSAAANLTTLPPEEQVAVVAAGPKAVKEKSGEIRRARKAKAKAKEQPQPATPARDGEGTADPMPDYENHSQEPPDSAERPSPITGRTVTIPTDNPEEASLILREHIARPQLHLIFNLIFNQPSRDGVANN